MLNGFTESGVIVHADTVKADNQGAAPNEEIKASVDTHEVDVTAGSVAAALNNSNAGRFAGPGQAAQAKRLTE